MILHCGNIFAKTIPKDSLKMTRRCKSLFSI